ncbi:hypothetical protein GCM10008920_11030 [Pediococcus acidilactici]|nr:hypothetical protein GCM10008920_11030 [Pediococcus acidilactici]
MRTNAIKQAKQIIPEVMDVPNRRREKPLLQGRLAPFFEKNAGFQSYLIVKRLIPRVLQISHR